ncbi:hypothetical protein L6452_06464 [Arctium lappa]|uniref:Uncharacterized protein n=1 Tax=Arctium lappa TaxID=4217 RepID=A0ACB9EKA0_ARCLA|nr:hypothetical protein L6452_06464 [Arctium lappa]
MDIPRELYSIVVHHPSVVYLEKLTTPSSTTPHGEAFRASKTRTPSKVDKGKTVREAQEPSSMTLNIKIPIDFMNSYVLEKKGMFPLMKRFFLPHNKGWYQDTLLDDVDAHAVEFFFLWCSRPRRHYIPRWTKPKAWWSVPSEGRKIQRRQAGGRG